MDQKVKTRHLLQGIISFSATMFNFFESILFSITLQQNSSWLQLNLNFTFKLVKGRLWKMVQFLMFTSSGYVPFFFFSNKFFYVIIFLLLLCFSDFL